MRILELVMAGFLAAALFATGLRAQQGPAGNENVAKQLNSVAAMQESIAKQRVSVQKQAVAAVPASFFVLPPPVNRGAAAPVPATSEDCEPLQAGEVDSLVKTAAAREDIGEDLLRNVIKQESGFRPCAVSPKGAQGLMQLMPATAEQFGLKDPLDPGQNVDAGAKFLKQLLVRYSGDLTKALGAYNAGPARVDAADGVPAITETQDYVARILASLAINH
jgi:soluble lytic murein transglycosylase-like protein